MFTVISVIIAILLLPCGGQPSCWGCNAYKCIEDKKQCGPEGYLLGYGLKYCNRFFESDVYDRYDVAGKAFISCTKNCLIGKIYENLQKDPSGTCDALKEFAFKSHVDCYTGCGFCDMCKTNKAALLHTYDLGDFFSKQALDQVYSVAKTCGAFPCF
ncbi:Protein W01A8.8 [Aphelenchoides avenae]|nr:Protein W01A8.8 [Aphelenchus avenae]